MKRDRDKKLEKKREKQKEEEHERRELLRSVFILMVIVSVCAGMLMSIFINAGVYARTARARRAIENMRIGSSLLP